MDHRTEDLTGSAHPPYHGTKYSTGWSWYWTIDAQQGSTLWSLYVYAQIVMQHAACRAARVSRHTEPKTVERQPKSPRPSGSQVEAMELGTSFTFRISITCPLTPLPCRVVQAARYLPLID